MNDKFVARYCNTTLTGASFAEIGDALVTKGFDMTRAYAKDDGVLMVPHAKSPKVTARLFAKLHPVQEAAKETPMSLDVANAALAGAKIMAGFEGAKVYTRDCGAVHPDGMLCIIPVFAEMACCTERIFPHDGPHQATDADGNVTHRWVEELIVRDLPFNSYGEIEESVS